MTVKIIADLREHEQSRVALLEDGKLTEIFIEFNRDEDGMLSPREKSSSSIREGDIFKARVETLVPAISAAFVKLSRKTRSTVTGANNAFMYVSEMQDPSAVKPGHEVIVQVIRNARKNKAPRVTPRISIPGRWLVLVPNSDEVGVSHRISDPNERKRLKVLAETLKSEMHNHGVIIRTAAENITEEYLRADLQSLLELWQEISRKADNAQAPCMLYRDIGTLGRVLRDEISGKIDEIIIDDPDEFLNAQNFIDTFCPECPDVKLYDGVTPIFEYFGIEDEIRKAVDKKVWLKSGAYLIIEQTEALTVIDVNTGKFTSEPDMRHTVLSTNKEAAEEISRQLRLRAIGGIIVVDFVDMDCEEDKHELLQHFQKFLSHDRMKARVFSITRLGLVELTRKRERPDLKSVLTRSCPLCGDNGFVEREESIALSVKRFIRKITGANNAEAFLIQTDNYSAQYICHYLDEWESEFGRKIFIAGTEDFTRGKYRLDFQGNISDAERTARDLRQSNKGKVIIYKT
ncbi:MAG: Rne/Rng family ribonuclease [Synergistaceae bacterium]|nr:Rne/Rng family ribonuclease [Synergistaceae bacterium]